MLSLSFNLASEHRVCVDTNYETKETGHCLRYGYVSFLSFYASIRMRKRSIRFVQDSGVGLFDEQIKHEDGAKKKRALPRQAECERDLGMEREKLSVLLKVP